MSSLGLHLRHNQHHTLFITQEKHCSQFNLHLHDQQPLRFHLKINSLIIFLQNYNMPSL
jgi:hypothetical protein